MSTPPCLKTFSKLGGIHIVTDGRIAIMELLYDLTHRLRALLSEKSSMLRLERKFTDQTAELDQMHSCLCYLVLRKQRLLRVEGCGYQILAFSAKQPHQGSGEAEIALTHAEDVLRLVVG